LVRIITPVYKGEEQAVTDARLQGFVRAMDPVLGEHVTK